MRRARGEVAAVGLILVLALVLRLVTRTSALPVDVNADEFAWAWDGQSLIVQHSPSSWSYLVHPTLCPCIADPVNGHLFPLEHPWLDEPPLFGLLVGGVAVTAGETAPAQVRPATIRVVPDVLSVITLLLGFVLARRLLGRAVAFAFALAFAFTPTMIAAGSLVEAEWLIAPTLLGALLLSGMRSRRACVGMLALCLLAPLTKETGVVVALSVAAVLVTERRWRLAAASVAAAAAGLLLFIGWAWLLDWTQFATVIHAQSVRHTSVGGSLVAFLLDLRAGYGNRLPFNDPVWFLGLAGVLVALIAMAWGRRWGALRVVVIPVLATSALMAFTEPATGIYNGWYRLAIYPLVYIAAAWLVVTGARAANHRMHTPRQVAGSRAASTKAE
jgi:hypothetical protein